MRVCACARTVPKGRGLWRQVHAQGFRDAKPRHFRPPEFDTKRLPAWAATRRQCCGLQPFDCPFAPGMSAGRAPLFPSCWCATFACFMSATGRGLFISTSASSATRLCAHALSAKARTCPLFGSTRIQDGWNVGLRYCRVFCQANEGLAGQTNAAASPVSLPSVRFIARGCGLTRRAGTCPRSTWR
jgi:hypothetical protein